MNVLTDLLYYLQFPFVRYALIVGILIALCASLLGVMLVLRRLSFMGDGLSHVAFGAIAIAAICNLSNEMLLVLPVTLICAVALLYSGRNAKIRGDAAVAMISVGALALGYLGMSLFSRSTNLAGDVCSTLFGSTSILTLSRTEVWLSAALSLIVLLVFVLLYHKLFAITFDEPFAQASGLHTRLYSLLIAVVIAFVIVLAMKLVGSLLISALLVFPALSAMRVFKSFRAVTVCAAVFSVVCAALGLVISIVAGSPVGPTVVAVDILGFALFSLLGTVRRKQ